MRRSNFNKKINRNSDFVYNRSPHLVTPDNMVPPNYFMDEIWLDNDELTTGVQIIELKSNGSAKSDQGRTPRTDNWTPYSEWNYSQEHLRHKEQRDVNERAREKRRMKLETNSKEHDFFRRLDDDYTRDSCIYTDYYSGETNDIPDNVVLNHQMNCFTILDKHFTVGSESSEEDYSDGDQINAESVPERCGRSAQFDANILTCDPDSEMEKRTVWIYSFKNKQLLSDNDFQLVNIPSQGTTCSTNSVEDMVSKIENPSVDRAATPIPDAYVPRLNLLHTPTLPTVTEVSEPKGSSSNNFEKSTLECPPLKKPMNVWFLSEHTTPKSEMNTTKTKSVVNWMALSPRENRRRFPNISPKNKSLPDLPSIKEINTFAEETPKTKKPAFRDSGTQTYELRGIIESPKHSYRRDLFSARSSVGVSCNLPSRISDSIQSYTEEEMSPQDRGDHNRNRRRIPRNLKIRFSPRPVVDCIISGPIENLESNWIGEEKSVQTSAITAEHFQRQEPSKILIRNMSLLKPAEWASYLPITGSLPSLQLSMNTDSTDEPRPWYTRIYRYIFKCCK